MKVNLTPDQKAFIRQAIQSGRFRREEDAVEEALSLWEERERARAEIFTEGSGELKLDASVSGLPTGPSGLRA